MVVLNACQSGAVGKELEASIATALLKAGCAAVVAMAYSVTRLRRPSSWPRSTSPCSPGTWHAVTAGRRGCPARLSAQPERGHALGRLAGPGALPAQRVSPSRRLAPADQPRRRRWMRRWTRSAPRRPRPGRRQDPLAAVGGVFVGRDDLFYQLETAARLQRVVVLYGPGGTGKTELAKGFARWWRDTGGVDDPRLVCWHSFEPGVASPSAWTG